MIEYIPVTFTYIDNVIPCGNGTYEAEEKTIIIECPIVRLTTKPQRGE
jgi:hypothetical protein